MNDIDESSMQDPGFAAFRDTFNNSAGGFVLASIRTKTLKKPTAENVGSPALMAYIWLVRSYSLLNVAVGIDSTIPNSTVSCITVAGMK